MNCQNGNKTFDNPNVQRLLESEGTFSGMWLKFGQETYPYDENFLKVSNFVKDNLITK